ncbi:MAG: QueT transporter family protein [Clostridiales bacterium]|jgi:ABC-type spermidine/putrescine transport system permease subunit II|nr:QueT transporter family protein [Clostridiales bacterium]HOB63649.1 QueT transporter family protein [Clostridia bacterium]
MKFSTKAITRAALIGVVYYVATVAIPAISYGVLQFRIGEALTLLPLVFPESVIGLTIGCLLANIFSPFGWADIVFGSLATLIAGLLTAIIGKKLKLESSDIKPLPDAPAGAKPKTAKLIIKCIIGALPPILVNAFMLPLVWYLMGFEEVYWINAALMLATQSGTILVIGTAIIVALQKAGLLEKSKLY